MTQRPVTHRLCGLKTQAITFLLLEGALHFVVHMLLRTPSGQMPDFVGVPGIGHFLGTSGGLPKVVHQEPFDLLLPLPLLAGGWASVARVTGSYARLQNCSETPFADAMDELPRLAASLQDCAMVGLALMEE